MSESQAVKLAGTVLERRPPRHCLTDDLEQGHRVAVLIDVESLYLWYERIGLRLLGSDEHGSYLATVLGRRAAWPRLVP